VSDDFRALSPRERVDVVERYAAERASPDGLALPQQTRGWLEVAKLTLADDYLSDKVRDERLDGWLRHLDAIPAAYADAARYELQEFVRYLDGLLRAEGGVEDGDEDDEP
jgi:hypothetical protein